MPTTATPVPRAALKVEEMAQALGLGRSKCWELVRSGEVRTVRFGRSVRVPVSEIERLIEQGGGHGS